MPAKRLAPRGELRIQPKPLVCRKGPSVVLLRSGWYLASKRVLDLVITLVLMVPAATLMLLSVLLVKLTMRGPVFYSQIRLGQGGRPFRLARALGPARPRLRLFLPAIEARAGDAHGLRRLLGCQAVRHGAAPSRNGVASSRRFDTWGLRVEKTRRRPTVPDNLPRQAKNLNGGLPRLVDSQLSASETPFPFSILPSHMYLSPDRRGVTSDSAIAEISRP